MDLAINPKLASKTYTQASNLPKEKDGEFGEMVKGLIEGVQEQSRQAETSTLLQAQNSVSTGDFSNMSLNIKNLDLNLKAMVGVRDALVKALNQIQQMPM